MVIVKQIICFIIWLCLIPLLAGIIPSYALERGKRKLGTIYLSGWIIMLAVFQIVAVPMVITKKSLTDLVIFFSGIMFFLTLAGLFIILVGVFRDSVKEFFQFPEWKIIDINDRVSWILVVGLILFQIVMSIMFSTPDGDDAYYVTHAVMADQTDMMYLKNAYTGADGILDARHVLAPFPMFIAFLARRSGMHAAALAHTVLPTALIVLTYLIYYKISTLLFPDQEKNKRSVFMVVMAGIQLFGNYSIYTNETFFVTRTWQGKSVLANIAIPAAFYILLRICARTEQERTDDEVKYGTGLAGLFSVLLAVNLVGALASSLGMLLLCILEGIMLPIIAIRNRRVRVIPAGIISAIPCIVYMFLYVIW